MDLEVRLVAGTNSRFDPLSRRWVEGRCWKVFLLDNRIVYIPKFAVLSQVQAGDEWVVLDLIDCEFSRQLFQDLFKREYYP